VVPKVLLELLDRKARKDQVEELVQVDNQDLREVQGLQVTREHPVSVVELVPQEHLDHRVPRDLLVLLEVLDR